MTVNNLNIDLNSLIDREPVNLQQEKIGDLIFNKVVLVTGAGGSIGSELVRQILHYTPAKIVLLDRAENNLFEIIKEVEYQFPEAIYDVALCDIQKRQSIIKVFERTKPTIVFHAAAYKHVHLVEENPVEAVYNNIIGSKNIIDVCKGFKVSTFVNISTDKSVNPTSIMGASKRFVESMVYFAGEQQTDSVYTSVRFGNVLGTSGSVIPLFSKQIRQGGPVTLTHPDMVRYFMTVSEAVQLVLQAASFGEQGKIYLLDMGKPVKILDLAKRLIKLHGFELDKDIAIEIIGIRAGEKLSEELFSSVEVKTNTQHDRIFEVLSSPILDLEKKILLLEIKAEREEDDEIRKILNESIVGSQLSLK